MNTLTGHAIYFRTSNTGCSTLHGESWTEADIVPERDGHNAIFRRARQATLDKLHENFPNYRPPSEREWSKAVRA